MTDSAPQNLEPDLSGRTLERYRLIRRLGLGGMGAVYEAEHVVLEKRFALKMLRQELTAQPVARKRFLREAKAASRVRHPHVVDISDFGETAQGEAFFVMELLSGRDLRQLIQAEGRLPWERTREILLQVISALDAAHAQEIIHRDMKPSNCFLVDVPGMEGQDVVKVLDFGIAKFAGAAGSDTEELTCTNEIFGTITYMAPEMALGVTNSPQCDIYAVGIMMYQMLVGEVPFKDGTAFQILSQHINDAPVPPRSMVPSIPAEVEAIVLEALMKKPEDRFESMRAFGAAIRRGSVHEDAEIIEEISTSSPPPPRVDATMMLVPQDTPGSMTVEPTTFLEHSSLGLHPPPLAEAAAPCAYRRGRTVVTPESSPSGVPSPAAHGLAPAPAHPPSYTPATPPNAFPAPPPSPTQVRTEDRPRRSSTPVGLITIVCVLIASAGGVGSWLLMRTTPHTGSTESIAAVSGPSESATPPRTPATKPSEAAAASPARERVIPAMVATHPDELAAPLSTETIEDAKVIEDTETTEDAETEPLVLEEDPTAPTAIKTPKKRAPKARSDAAVVRSLKAKIGRQCRHMGWTTMKVEGLISTEGRVLSPLVSPGSGPASCVKKLVKQARFSPGNKLRPLPKFSLEL